jgi:hypothetical protein
MWKVFVQVIDAASGILRSPDNATQACTLLMGMSVGEFSQLVLGWGLAYGIFE